jgi:hypothetical protein
MRPRAAGRLILFSVLALPGCHDGDDEIVVIGGSGVLPPSLSLIGSFGTQGSVVVNP